MSKCTNWAEAMSNIEKIKHVALAAVKLRLFEGIRLQAGSKLVSRKFC